VEVRGMRAIYIHLEDGIWEKLDDIHAKTKISKRIIVNDALMQYFEVKK